MGALAGGWGPDIQNRAAVFSNRLEDIPALLGISCERTNMKMKEDPINLSRYANQTV